MNTKLQLNFEGWYRFSALIWLIITLLRNKYWVGIGSLSRQKDYVIV